MTVGTTGSVFGREPRLQGSLGPGAIEAQSMIDIKGAS
jgi:hypothetical protein